MEGRGVCAIDLAALAHNLGEVRRIVGQRVRICAVVKADAYGHGAVPISRTLLAHGADALAVASFDEARELRRAGLAAPVLVLGGVHPSEAPAAAELGLAVVVWDAAGAARLAAAVPSGKRLRVHLKVDTGMTRIGAPLEELGAVVDALRPLPLEIEGVMSHLACADRPGDASVERQRLAFERALAALAATGIRPTLRHVANSAGLLTGPELHYDMVRPGIALYGGFPDPAFAARAHLRPVMQLRASVRQVRRVPAGASVGYGLTFTAQRPSRIAVLAVGYAQGYPRALSNCGRVVVRGRLAPVVGMVSMDHTTIDVSEIPGVEAGDEAVLWGHDEEPRLDVMEIGELAGTLGHELLTRVGRDVGRTYSAAEPVAKQAS